MSNAGLALLKWDAVFRLCCRTSSPSLALLLNIVVSDGCFWHSARSIATLRRHFRCAFPVRDLFRYTITLRVMKPGVFRNDPPRRIRPARVSLGTALADWT